MPTLLRASSVRDRGIARAIALAAACGSVIGGSLMAQQPEPAGPPGTRDMVLQGRLVQPINRLERANELQAQVWIDDVQIDWVDEQALINIQLNAQNAGGNQVVWVNDGLLMRRGTGLALFNRLDAIPRDDLTADRVLDLLGWSGMSSAHADPPLDITDWSDERILAALDDPDASLRRQATRALALADRFDERKLLEMLQNDQLTLEQRSRLLDVSFAQFVAAPRAAIGAQFNTRGMPIQIDSLFANFPAAQQRVLRPGDQLVEIDGVSLMHPNAFNIVRASVLSRQAGETVPMVVRRPFAPDVVARIVRERQEANERRLAEAIAEAEAQRDEAMADAAEQTNPWENDPVWQNIMRQVALLEAKDPEGATEIAANGDFIFAGQRLGNIAHLDGLFARGRRAANADLPVNPMDPEDLLVPGESINLDVPLGSLAQLQQDGGGLGGPGAADLHTAWRHRLSGLGIELLSVTAETLSIRTPDLGWLQSNVSQRLTTMVSAPRSPRQHLEQSPSLMHLARGLGGRGVWQQPNVMVAGAASPFRPGPVTQDSTAFRVQSTDLADPVTHLRRDAAINDEAATLSSLRERRGELSRRLRALPGDAASPAMQRELERLDQRIALIESDLRLNDRR